MKINDAFPLREPINAIYLLRRYLPPFFVAHAELSSKTEELCRQIISWQKPVYTFDSDYNKNLIKIGVWPVNMDNVSLWTNLFAAHNE